MQRPDARTIARMFLVYLGAITSGWIAARIGIPLPWMIGALVFTTAISIFGMTLHVPAITRPFGQIVVAGSVGLAFTPVALAALASVFPAMVAGALLTLLAGFLVAWVLLRLTHTDAITATLSSVPMGPVESANLAQRYGIQPGPVVFAQTLRIMLIIVSIPPAILLIDGSVADPNATLRAMPWTVSGATLLMIVALCGAYVFMLLKVSNPFFLGPLAGSALASALSLPVTAVPYVLLATAQILLGVWLGAVFDREMFRRAGGFIPAAVASTLLMIILCLLIGLAFAAVMDASWPTMVLAMAPGSVTEMALTAKVLQEGVALVTAYHIVRIFIIIPTAPLMIRWTARITKWSPPTHDRPPRDGT